MEDKIEKILFNTILEGSELFRAVDDINDLFKSEMIELLYKYLEYKELRYSQVPFNSQFIKNGEYVIVSENKIIETFLEQLEQ